LQAKSYLRAFIRETSCGCTNFARINFSKILLQFIEFFFNLRNLFWFQLKKNFSPWSYLQLSHGTNVTQKMANKSVRSSLANKTSYVDTPEHVYQGKNVLIFMIKYLKTKNVFNT
jgi:hypothetical protein